MDSMPCFSDRKYIVLFHGGIEVVKNPYIKKNDNPGDFGYAFYLTTKKSQAESWAMNKRKIRKKRNGVVSVFRLYTDDLNIRYLNQIDEEWADFIAKGRLGLNLKYDVIVGGVADDTVWNICQNFVQGLMTPQRFIEEAKVLVDKDQYAIKSEKALNSIEYMYSYEVM